MNPAVLRDYQFALTHTPAPQAVKLKFRAIRGRLRTVYALLKVSLSVYTFLSYRAAVVQPMRENSLLWIGSRACSHKNGIFDWVVVFVSFNIKRKKEF